MHFSDAVLLSTLDAFEFLVNGQPATGVSVVDGDTVVFDLPNLLGGAHDVLLSVAAPDGSTLAFAPFLPTGSLAQGIRHDGAIGRLLKPQTVRFNVSRNELLSVVTRSHDLTATLLIELIDLGLAATAPSPGTAILQPLTITFRVCTACVLAATCRQASLSISIETL